MEVSRVGNLCRKRDGEACFIRKHPHTKREREREKEKERGRWRLFIPVFYLDRKMHDLVAVLKLADSVR